MTASTATKSVRVQDSWVLHLERLIDPDWRNDEWFPEALLFNGDPDNPKTTIARCNTPGCGALTRVRVNPICASCFELRKLHDDDEKFLVAVANSREGWRNFLVGDAPRGRCNVQRAGNRCQRESFAQGVCNTHWSSWKRAHREQWPDIAIWAERGVAPAGSTREMTALEPRPQCRILGCQLEIRSPSSGLCHNHAAQWAKAGRPDLTAWTASTPPCSRVGTFSFVGLPQGLQMELRYVLEARDRDGYSLDPDAVRIAILALLKAGTTTLTSPASARDARETATSPAAAALIGRATYQLAQEFRRFGQQDDPTVGDVWDTALVGMPTAYEKSSLSSSRRTSVGLNRRELDFTCIHQLWLRELAKTYLKETLPDTAQAQIVVRGMGFISSALRKRADGDDQHTAGREDVRLALKLVSQALKKDGEPYRGVFKYRVVSSLKSVLDYGRQQGLLGGVPDSFMLLTEDTREFHSVKRKEDQQEEEGPGKALPDRVITKLLSVLPQMPALKTSTGAYVSGEDAAFMYRTAIRVLIDTGRRPSEIVSLQVGCVLVANSHGAVTYTLKYDNHKAQRFGRKLPISAGTAQAILDWEDRRREIDLPPNVGDALFVSSAAGRIDGRGMTTGTLNHALSRLVEFCEPLDSDVPDRDSGGYRPFSDRIFPYSFRHSYAQRHADAGVAPDVLKSLMDHRSIETTMGYYRINSQRKREAIEKVGPLAIDRHGRPAPVSSTEAYEVGMVAVPFGSCTEPTNVAAGGQSCPLRFRCSGCDMYRSDPSHLPALASHIAELRANLAIVESAGIAADWVIRDTAAEIDAYQAIINSLNARLAGLPPQERAAVEEASAAMRKVRAGTISLPIVEVRGPR